MALQNLTRFQRSITNEIDILKNRVRDLIGDANWSEEGRYKEAVVRNDDHVNGQNSLISTQIDILIYEDNVPVIFREGDFVIITDTSVRAAIEVKSKVTNYASDDSNSLNHVLAKFNSLLRFPSFRQEGQRQKFVGLFVFDYTGNIEHSRVNDALIASNGLVNHISLGPNKFIRYWDTTQNLTPPLEYEGRCYIKYNLTALSYSYFISNLLHIVADVDPVERYWFSFPIEGTKEQHRIEPITQLPDFQNEA
jgi:hypothetical protein